MREIVTEELRYMEGREGLILQGCGGSLDEWVDGINQLLTEESILLNGSKFKDVFVFQRDGLTCLLFPFEGVELDAGKLAVWRLKIHGQFGGTWLSDYVNNRLGGFEISQEKEKLDCPLIGEDGNIFHLIGVASRTLRRNGLFELAEEMRERITGGACRDYFEALNIIGEYVNITDGSEPSMDMGDMT